MSELKAETIVPQGCTITLQMYPKAEVDAAIAELKAENKRLKKYEIWMKQHFYCEEVIACESAKNRQLKRALWLARAERASAWQIHFSLIHNHSIKREFSINGASSTDEGMVTMRTARDWAMVWQNVERKCRAKAEEYK